RSMRSAGMLLCEGREFFSPRDVLRGDDSAACSTAAAGAAPFGCSDFFLPPQNPVGALFGRPPATDSSPAEDQCALQRVAAAKTPTHTHNTPADLLCLLAPDPPAHLPTCPPACPISWSRHSLPPPPPLAAPRLPFFPDPHSPKTSTRRSDLDDDAISIF